MLELLTSFIVSFLFTWFFLNVERVHGKKNCDNKNTIMEIAVNHCSSKKMVKELREYSLTQIQQGHFEYGEVLEQLKKKEKQT